jgi:hypothetical protein
MLTFIDADRSYSVLKKLYLALSAIIFLLMYDGAVAQPRPAGGSIHGFVAVVIPPNPTLAAGTANTTFAPGSNVFVPNIEVIARNIRANTASPKSVTNAQGFFQIPDLAPGEYRICVAGAGFTGKCEEATIAVAGPVVIMDHIVTISPEEGAIIGTVTLADHRTPCFWFRPSISPTALTARVSLLSADGKVVAGPVEGNVSGQYVLPARAADTARLRVECDAGVAETTLPLRAGVNLRDLALPVSTPSILAFDFSKNGVGIRRADPGDTVTATVLAKDPDGNPLRYAWTDDSGRALNLPDSPTVQWPLSNVAAFNTLHVQVSNGKGGISTSSRSIKAGANAIFFSGRVFNRQTNAGVAGAAITLNGTSVTADAAGNFKISGPDAARFVLNVTHPGFALSSLVLLSPVVGIQVPLDPVQTATVNGATGGSISVPPGSGGACNCMCKAGEKDGHDERFHIVVEIPDTRIDIRHGGEKHVEQAPNCPSPTGGAANLALTFEPGSFINASGVAYAGTVSVEAFQYNLNTPNPIPGDFGAVYQGKQVRLATFGAFHLLPRDAQGQTLAMAAGKKANVSMPIQPGQLAAAPATIPLFHYDEGSGQWLEDGTLTRSGNNYVGQITHFSVFNADTVFPGGACVKALLSGFAMPVTLDAVYYDPVVGSFHHNGFSTSETTVGVERMSPNQIFTLTVTDSATPTPAVVASTINSGPGLDPNLFPSGYDTDTVNFSHCNGPVSINNLTLLANKPYFLGPIFGGTITDNSMAYQMATDAQLGGSRDTLTHWKQTNGFAISALSGGQPCAAPNQGEFCAAYFNNGDLKFGRDMHCRVTNPNGATACYVANFGQVGTDDAPLAMTDVQNYENSGQAQMGVTQPGATVTMEYDPVTTDKLAGVQFWAYDINGNYFPKPALDSQGGKPIPDICTACHQGAYQPATQTVAGASFLPFDLDSFLDNTGTPFPANSAFVSSQQQQFHALNNIIAGIPSPGITPTAAIAQLIQPTASGSFWYSSTTTSVPFTFNQGAANLPPSDPFPGHEPLYDSVVKVVCRTCHVAIPNTAGALQWNTYAQMTSSLVPAFVCGPSAPPSPMPHAEVPWLRFWSQGLSGTLAGQLNLNSCQSPP